MKWLRSFWQKVKKPLEILIVTVVCLLVIVRAYIFNVSVAGLAGKNLWDWLQLLIIRAVLAVGGYMFTYTTSRNDRTATEKRTQAERDIALDNQREAALQAYIGSMSELLLKEHLSELKPEYENVRQVARVRTLTVLPRLDGKRKASVLQFLHESGLIDKDNKIIDLRAANLYEAKLNFAELHGANLGRAILCAADLSGADLSGADLVFANLHEAILSGADALGANLLGANVTTEQLKQTISLSGATMPDGTIHP